MKQSKIGLFVELSNFDVSEAMREELPPTSQLFQVNTFLLVE